MTGFEPGEGWREMGPDDGGIGPGETYLVLHEPDGDTTFVREVPVPPLPTETYTVIRVTWADPPHGAPNDWAKLAPGYWHGRLGYFQSDAELQRRITAFEVLAEPRAVAAKAVLDLARRVGVNRAASEFGVDQ